MNPRTLEQFLALTDALHYGRASLAANVSLSTLSRSIRQMEDELGVPLFERDNRSVSLTAHGQIVEHYARDALTRLTTLRQQLASASGPLIGELSLYCSVTASHSILFDLLEQFRPDFPGVEIKLQTGDPDEAIDRMVAGKADLSIAARPRSLPRGVVFRHVSSSPLLFIAPETNAEAYISENRGDPPVRWAEAPMILPTGGLSRTRVDAWFKTHNVAPRIYAQVAGNEAIVSMVSLGLGIGVVPEIVLQNSPLADKVQILKVTPALEPFDLGLFTLRRSLGNPLVQAFWKTSEFTHNSEHPPVAI